MSKRTNYRNHRPHQDKETSDVAVSFDANSPVLAMFKAAATMLNQRQDRHERLVKLSRDVTIESKRIIFQLHSNVIKADESKTVKEALERLRKLIEGPIKNIGLELEHRCAYLHSRAITSGLQEFIEARTLCHLIQHRELLPWQQAQNEFQYTVKQDDNEEDRSVVTVLPKVDYMLGLADLTGELMRRTINSIASGDNDESFYVCRVIRDLFTGFLGVSGACRELHRKLSTSRANTLKAENAVYAVRVRGGEAPATLLAIQHWELPPTVDDDDEGPPKRRTRASRYTNLDTRILVLSSKPCWKNLW